MSNRLNSISKRLLESNNSLLQSPQKDDTIEFLQNSGIGFGTCSTCQDTDTDYEFQTGFDSHDVLYLEKECSKPKLNIPLYKENFLSEFKTEEEKATARHALGLYNKGDVVGMSLLTTDDGLPSGAQWLEAEILQLKRGDKFFTPLTSTDSVYDSEGTTLSTRLSNLQTSILEQKKEITKLTKISTEKTITSLGDVKVFLQGFNNGDVLKDTLDEITQGQIRFEKTGEITINN